MVRLLYIAIIALLGAIHAVAAPEFTVAWSANNVLPGEVVELQVKMTSTHAVEFELKLADDDAVEMVARHPGPPLYQGGVCSREDALVMQPTRAGTISLKGLQATVREGGTTSDRKLEVPLLVVRSYGNVPDDFTPQPLPEPLAGLGVRRGWGLWIALGLAVMLVLTRLVFRKPRVAVLVSAPLSVMDSLREILECDDLPMARIERLLAGGSPEISGGLRVAMEAAVYGKNVDREKLRELVTREVGR